MSLTTVQILYRPPNHPRTSTAVPSLFLRKIKLLLDKLNFPVTILRIKCSHMAVRVEKWTFMPVRVNMSEFVNVGGDWYDIYTVYDYMM